MAMEDDLGVGVGGDSPPPPAATTLSLNSRAAASFPRLAPLEPVEQRKKRLIKKRELGSCSRARKHAHLTKIQSELNQLLQENHQLRLKYDQLRASVEVSMPVPASKTLHRVLSAHF